MISGMRPDPNDILIILYYYFRIKSRRKRTYSLCHYESHFFSCDTPLWYNPFILKT